MLQLTICQVKGKKMQLEVDGELTVFDVKSLIECEWETFPAEEQRLIYKGKILKDEDELRELKISSGAKFICVPKKKKKKASPMKNTAAPAPQPAPSSTPNVTATQPQSNPMNLFSQMGQNGMPNMGQMQQQLMQNPEMMQQMMQNPMVQSMLNNPEIMQNMFESNPQLRSILDSNPQIRHVLNDPETMRQAMQAASNPEVYQEMLRNQDRALANISNMPGGFNALSRMYNQVQAPMEEALLGMNGNREETVISEIDTSTGPTSSAMPNPFSSNSQADQPNQPQTQSQPSMQNNPMLANLFGNMNMNNSQNANQPSQNANQPSQNANQPNQMQSMMQMMQQNPGMMQQMMQGMQQPAFSPPTNPEEHWANELTQLQSMGFTNGQENINALTQSRGNVQAAINILMLNRGLN